MICSRLVLRLLICLVLFSWSFILLQSCTYSCPPPCMRNAGEVCLWHVMLHSVNHGGETEDTHGDEEEEAAHLLVALTQSEAECPQACGVSCQFQDTKDSHQSHDTQHLSQLSHLPHCLQVSLMLHVVFLIVKELQDSLEELRQDGNQVHSVKHAPAEGFEVGSGHQTQQVLHGEEGDAYGLHIFPVCLATEVA